MSTLHALDHASRLAETAGGEGGFETGSNGSGSMRAVKLLRGGDEKRSLNCW